ncbi:inorganic phosphate transporter, partial [Cupriavidus basilensis]
AIYEQLETITDMARGRCQHHRRQSSWKTPEAHIGMQTIQMSLWVIALLVALALLFDFMNGFHDAANSIATVVSTGVLKPHHAVAMAAMLQRGGYLYLPSQGGGHGGNRHDRR